MRPLISILHESFAYVPAYATAVQDTWRRFGWSPMTEEERKVRIERALAQMNQSDAFAATALD
jgi:hypothetical protein